MYRSIVSALALAGLAGSACAQSVEFRVVEREGQTTVVPGSSIPTTDSILVFAVQARVVGGGPMDGVSDFAFTIRAPCESDDSGTLARLLTSNVDGTYAVNPFQIANSTVGRGGLAAQFTYLAGINQNFNGMINTSSGGFTNGPDQEIGLVHGYTAGSALLQLTDLNQDNNPDTWPGTGTTAPIEPSYAAAYLGAGGNWVDVYRFKYTINSAYPARILRFVLDRVSAQVATGLQIINGVWQPVQSPVSAVADMGGIVIVNFAEGSTTGACCDAATGACVTSNGVFCNNIYLPGCGCEAIACPQPGPCCSGGNACSLTIYSLCTGSWVLGSSCSPSPCGALGSCCDATGGCTSSTNAGCGGTWTSAGSCTPNPCPQTGACCRAASCVLATTNACSGQFHGIGSACGTAGNLTTCCPANFDGASGVTVQDIFAFLEAWFAGDVRADFDRDSALSVFDIFSFLHDWFVGCS